MNTWQNKTESYLNSLPVQRGNSDPIRLAASPTRIYIVYRGTNGRLKLGEMSADGRTANLEIGELFTQTNAICRGLTWDPALGALRALIQVGSNQFLYQVDPSTGLGSVPISMPSGSTYTGLAKMGTQLITQGAGNTTLFNITLTGLSAAVRAISGKTSPYNGANQRGMTAHGSDSIVFISDSGTLSRLAYASNIRTSITWPNPGSNYSGVTVFGNNILAARVNSTSLGLGTTYLLRNTALERIGSTDYSGARNIVPVAKRDDHHVYVVLGNNLYQWDQGTGVRRLIGSTQSGLSCLVWAYNTLYGIGGNRIYTINTQTGAATAGAALRTSFTPIAGGEGTNGRLVVWNTAGSVQNLHISSGLLSSVLSLGTNRGGFYEGGNYYTVDPNGNVRVKGSSQSDAQTLLLDPASIPDSRFAGGVFEINGQLFMFAVRSGSARFIKYSGLFPRFYRRGSIIDLLTLPGVPNRELGSGYSVTTYTLPIAAGGKGPFTYSLLYRGSTTLPANISFNASTRVVSVGLGVTPGRYILEYKVTDSEQPSQSVSQAFEIAVDPPVQQPAVGDLALASEAYTRNAGTSTVVSLANATGGTRPYTYQLGVSTGSAAQPATNWSSSSTTAVSSFGEYRAAAAQGNDVFAVKLGAVQFSPQGTQFQTLTLSRFAGSTYTKTDFTTRVLASNPIALVRVAENKFYMLTRSGQLFILTISSNTLSSTLVRLTSGTYLGLVNIRGTFYTVRRAPTYTENSPALSIQAVIDSGHTGGAVVWLFTNNVRTVAVYNNRFYYTTKVGTTLRLRYVAIPTTLASTSFTAQSNVLTIPNGLTSITHPIFGSTTEYYAPITFVGRRLYYIPNPGLSNASLRYLAPTDGKEDDFALGALPAGITFEPSVNTLELDSHAAAGTYTLTHVVTDSTSATVQSTVTFTVSPVAYPPITFSGGTSTTLTKASTGRVEWNIPRASGGKSPLVYDVQTRGGADLDTLSGITFVEAGTRKYLIIDKNDVAAGTTNLRVVVTDNRGVQAIQNISVTAYSRIALTKPRDITISGITPTTTTNLPKATGGSGTYRYSMSGVPSGASFNAATPSISYSRRVANGTYTLRFTAVDTTDATNTVTQTFTMTRTAVTLSFVSTVADRTVYPEADGATASVSITLPAASGGTTPYTYDLQDDAGVSYDTSGSAGITFNAATRVMTYDPDLMSEGPNNFVYRATDSSGNTGSLTFVFTVRERLQLAKPANVTISDTTQQTTTRLPVATGGSGNYSYEITGAPANFTVATAPPTIQYTNTVARGTYTITYKVTDTTSNDSITQTFTVTSTVTPEAPLQLPKPSDIVHSGIVSQQRILGAARGGKPPYTYSVTGLPSGATFAPATRTLVLPKTLAVGIYTLGYRVVDTSTPTPKSVTQIFTLRVAAAERVVQLLLPRTTGLNYVAGTPAVKDMASAQGGTEPYTYELTLSDGNPLPAGFTYDATANRLSVAANAPLGRYTFKHKVTDSSAPNISVENELRARVTRAPLTYLPVTLPGIELILHNLGTPQTVPMPAAAGGDGDFVYRIVKQDGSRFPWGYRLDGQNLIIDPDIPVGEVRFLYQATDGQGTTTSVPFRVLSVDQELIAAAVTTTPVEIGCEPVIVSRITPQHGVAPYSYRIRGGEGHFAVYDGDVIASKDTPAGHYDLEVEVTDASAGDVDLTLRTVVVTRSAEVCPMLEPLPRAADTLELGELQTTFTTFNRVPFNLQLASTDGARYRVENLPTGLSFNPETQRLTVNWSPRATTHSDTT